MIYLIVHLLFALLTVPVVQSLSERFQIFPWTPQMKLATILGSFLLGFFGFLLAIICWMSCVLFSDQDPPLALS